MAWIPVCVWDYGPCGENAWSCSGRTQTYFITNAFLHFWGTDITGCNNTSFCLFVSENCAVLWAASDSHTECTCVLQKRSCSEEDHSSVYITKFHLPHGHQWGPKNAKYPLPPGFSGSSLLVYNFHWKYTSLYTHLWLYSLTWNCQRWYRSLSPSWWTNCTF